MKRYFSRFCGATVVIALSLTVTSASSAFDLELPNEEDRWIKVETSNFTVFSNADVKIAKKNAQSLEQLWAVLARDFDRVPAVSPIPIDVFVFDFFSDAFLPYGPLSKKGRPKKSGGYFMSRELGDYVAIVERDYRYPNRMDLYHQFVHAVLGSYHPELPLWLEEGLSEYYSVFHVEDGEARVGYRINRHIARIRNNSLIPLADLLAIDRTSPEYDEDDRTGMYYAESWLLTHFLLTERPDGRANAALYAEFLREGCDRNAAFSRAFKTTVAELEAELRKYVRARSYHYKVFPLSKQIIGNTEVSDITRSEVLTRLGYLIASGLGARYEFAAEHFSAALDLDENYGPAVAGLGFLEETAGRQEAALKLFERSVELNPKDYRINLLLGRSLAALAGSVESDDARATLLQRSRQLLRHAAELRSELVEPWAMLGSTYLSDSGDADKGIEALDLAMKLQPKRPDIGLNLVTLYVNQGSTAEAWKVIDRMGAAGVDADVLRRAREIVLQTETAAASRPAL